MGPEIVIAMYRPKKGQETQLTDLVKKHGPTLREKELVTDRPTVIARAKDGTLLEIFEWNSADAARKAHTIPAVAQIWEAMEQFGEFATLGSLQEAQHEFPHFTPVDR